MNNNPPLSPAADLQKQFDLLQKEYNFEKENYEKQSERLGLLRKTQQGLCWYPLLVGRAYYNSLNHLVVEVERQAHQEEEHLFEHGKSICFFTADFSGKPTYLSFSATVSYVQESRMVITLPHANALAELQRTTQDLGVQLYFDETSYKAMFNALRQTMQATGSTRLAHLRDTLLGNSPAEKRTLYPLHLPWLNSSQAQAVNKVLEAKETAVVHGPPGTGKTTTLVEAVYETLRRETQVLVCAQSNTAVDWIAEKLVDRGVSVLRIGNPTRVNDKMLEFTYERRFAAHPSYAELWSIRKAIRTTQSQLRQQNHDERERNRNHISRLRLRAEEIEMEINASLFGEARVVASTLVGSSNRLLDAHRFSSLFIDEAAQALEAACWIAISKADRVIFAGDHWQLPPTIKCHEAARGGLDHTLMEKIVRRKPDAVSMLTLQYRMHETIMRFPSLHFYDGQLRAAPEVCHRSILEWDHPLSWIDTADEAYAEETMGETPSRLNRPEAERLVEELKIYIERLGKERILEENIDFGLISPYRSQVQYIRHLLKQDRTFRPLRHLLTVHTVDGFQGQERDVVFISLVRANAEGSIGFLADLRRMNVAMTRARMKLVILGDSTTLRHHRFYRDLHRYIAETCAAEDSTAKQ